MNFHVSVSNYQKFQPITFEYLLDGYINEWTENSETPIITFNNLKPGSYQFKVRAKIGALYSENTESISFSVERPWFFSNFMIANYFLVFAILFFFLNRSYEKYYQEKEEKMMRINKSKLELIEFEKKQALMAVENTKLQTDIESKNRELAVSTMSMIKKNQFLSKIKFKRKEKPVESARAIHQRRIEKAKQRPKTKIEPKVQTIETSKRSEEAKQVNLFDTVESGQLPELSLLDDAPDKVSGYSEDTLQAMSKLLEIKLADFNIAAEVISVKPGPVVTRFEIQPAAGVKVSQISNLSKDLARALSTVSVRVVEVIPGKPYVGIEIPNEQREVITLGEIIKSKDYEEIGSTMAIALGKDISGNPVVADLAKMPHLLIAGTTGSGKSVGINAMILSLLYKSTPKDVKLILIDPKMLELSVYDGIPNLFTEVVTDMKKAAAALKWCVAEMDKRYRLMSHLGVRNLAGYNKKINDSIRDKQPILDPLWKSTEQLSDEPRYLEPLPNIVIVIDELADLMLVVGKAVEELIARLAQKARASGIHMIIATQKIGRAHV